MSKLQFDDLVTLCRQYRTSEGINFEREEVNIYGHYTPLADTFAAILLHGHRPRWRRDNIGQYISLTFEQVDVGEWVEPRSVESGGTFHTRADGKISPVLKA